MTVAARAVSGVHCAVPLEYWDRGFEFHWENRCIIYAFLPCFSCLLLVEALGQTDSSSKLSDVYEQK